MPSDTPTPAPASNRLTEAEVALLNDRVREQWTKVLYSHRGQGQCPDALEGWATRDPECDACKTLDELLAARSARTAGQGYRRGPDDGFHVGGGHFVTHSDWVAFTRALGYGDDQSEPAATPAEMLEYVERAFSAENDHRECPVICEPCGERLADTMCEHCHGSGGNNDLINLTCGYSECEWCGGAGKVHVGCVEKSYDDLAALAAPAHPADEALARVAAIVDEWADEPLLNVAVSRLRAALAAPSEETGDE